MIGKKHSKCFDITAEYFMGMGNCVDQNMIVCHGIVEAGRLGCAGTTGHAWVEKDDVTGKKRIAVDPTNHFFTDRDKFRSDLKARNICEYSPHDFLYNWWINGMPGPWDEEIKYVTKK